MTSYDGPYPYYNYIDPSNTNQTVITGSSLDVSKEPPCNEHNGEQNIMVDDAGIVRSICDGLGYQEFHTSNGNFHIDESVTTLNPSNVFVFETSFDLLSLNSPAFTILYPHPTSQSKLSWKQKLLCYEIGILVVGICWALVWVKSLGQ